MRAAISFGRAAGAVLGFVTAALLLTGCPGMDYSFQFDTDGITPDTSPTNNGVTVFYSIGFEDGFAVDDWYWEGYYDSYDTVDFGPILYEGSDIPYIEEPTYEAGYWDGIWWAYNDGYFTSYRYAFIIGFSEGYDNAYWSDYLAFLASDTHTEYLDGGGSDGYNDGFSEGRVFGAYDYEARLPFDWMDALQDYESGTDLYFEEVDVGTGADGPVYIYEYGTDPRDLMKGAPKTGPKVGADNAEDVTRHGVTPETNSYFRPLNPTTEQELNITPTTAPRSDRKLRLESTWLERIETYQSNEPRKTTQTDHGRTIRSVQGQD